MFGLNKIFGKDAMQELPSREQITKLLDTNPEALKIFEEKYASFSQEDISENFFNINSRQAAAMQERTELTENTDALIERIVQELLAETRAYVFDGNLGHMEKPLALPDGVSAVTLKDVQQLPVDLRPQLTGGLMMRDIEEPAYASLLMYWSNFLKEKDPRKRQTFYHQFRQGLDILDLDDITYQIIDRNMNSMGHWLPQVVEACRERSGFKIPATTIVKVPLTMLQLTRQDYGGLASTTLQIVDQWAQKAFSLDTTKEYFVKTGTYSSKFDFRNCHVHGEKEVRELGEYLLYIHYQALQMASPLSKPCIYGASTTTEWVVREFIPDQEDNLMIYHGMPLHTEYRVFVDCDTDEVIGISPYWEPETMKKRFAEGQENIHHWHDYVIFQKHEKTLMDRYEANREKVMEMVREILPNLDLPGQWSIDIMQNGDDFWLIDMALAETSAFYDCVPKELRHPTQEDWIPKLDK